MAKSPQARADILGMLHRMVEDFEQIKDAVDAHAKAAIAAGEIDTHAALSGLATTFSEFRNHVLSLGRTLPESLAAEAAGLVDRAKLPV